MIQLLRVNSNVAFNDCLGLFGICNYGVDINGYVMDPEKGLCIWLQRRSPTKQTWPGRWDNMVSKTKSFAYLQ